MIFQFARQCLSFIKLAPLLAHNNSSKKVLNFKTQVSILINSLPDYFSFSSFFPPKYPSTLVTLPFSLSSFTLKALLGTKTPCTRSQMPFPKTLKGWTLHWSSRYLNSAEKGCTAIFRQLLGTPLVAVAAASVASQQKERSSSLKPIFIGKKDHPLASAQVRRSSD